MPLPSAVSAVSVVSLAAALYLLCAGAAAQTADGTTTLTIIHYDHSQLNGSFATTTGLMRTLQQALVTYPAALLLNPTGHLGKRLWIQHDASAPNRQDLVGRLGQLDARSSDVDPLLAANVRLSVGTSVRPSTVRTTTGGLRVGIVGFVSAGHQRDPQVVSQRVHVSDPEEAVRSEARRLRSNGVPFVVGLGNAGFPEDQLVTTRVTGVDAVVAAAGGGDGYPLALRQESGKLVPLLQAPPNSVCITTLLLNTNYTMVDWGGIVIPVRDVDEDEV